MIQSGGQGFSGPVGHAGQRHYLAGKVADFEEPQERERKLSMYPPTFNLSHVHLVETCPQAVCQTNSEARSETW